MSDEISLKIDDTQRNHLYGKLPRGCRLVLKKSGWRLIVEALTYTQVERLFDLLRENLS